jgi:hypothetical protein
MIVLVSGATTYARNDHVGYFIEPRGGHLPTTLDLRPGLWAMDNGAYSGFDAGAFVRMLERYHAIPGCLFVSAPDYVADAASTRARWPFWSRLIRGLGHRPAFIAQDGLTPDAVPWDEIGALFIGGSSAFKDGAIVRSLCGLAKARGLWVHWGRVNGERRYHLALKAGADSIDGSGFSMYPNTCLARVPKWETSHAQQPELPV